MASRIAMGSVGALILIGSAEADWKVNLYKDSQCSVDAGVINVPSVAGDACPGSGGPTCHVSEHMAGHYCILSDGWLMTTLFVGQPDCSNVENALGPLEFPPEFVESLWGGACTEAHGMFMKMEGSPPKCSCPAGYASEHDFRVTVYQDAQCTGTGYPFKASSAGDGTCAAGEPTCHFADSMSGHICARASGALSVTIFPDRTDCSTTGEVMGPMEFPADVADSLWGGECTHLELGESSYYLKMHGSPARCSCGQGSTSGAASSSLVGGLLAMLVCRFLFFV